MTQPVWRECTERVSNFAQTGNAEPKHISRLLVRRAGGKAMSNITHLRMRAQSCLRLYDQSQDPEMKDRLVSMAQRYVATALGLRLSESAVSNEDGAIKSPLVSRVAGLPIHECHSLRR